MTSTTEIELDSGPRAQEVERLCVATREVRPVSDLIRFVRSEERRVGKECVP